MKIIAKLIAAGVDPELVGEVAQAIADAQTSKDQSRTLRQERNARYYENSRLNKTLSDVGKTPKTLSDDQDASSRARGEEDNHLNSKKISYQKDPLKGVQKGKVQPNSTALAEDAQPTEKDRAVAERVGMDEATFRTEWIRFRGHHVARGNRMKNWHQAWVTWAHGWRPNARAGPPPRSGDGIGDARQMLRERLIGGRDHNEGAGQCPSASDAGDASPYRGPSQQARAERDDGRWGGQVLDLLAERAH